VFITAPLEAMVYIVLGPTVWNSLADDLLDPAVDFEHFKQDLKTNLFTRHFGVLEH